MFAGGPYVSLLSASLWFYCGVPAAAVLVFKAGPQYATLAGLKLAV